ncbi:MAG: hypothetical protein P8Y94_12420 [Acidobacteriota bacterium]
MELRYTHPSECEAGTLLRLLERSYAPLVESEPEIWAQEQKNWRGFGTQQIMELLRRLRSMEIREARASTLDHPFFVPAQRMYVRCGFREVRRNSWDRDDRRNLICYAKTIG